MRPMEAEKGAGVFGRRRGRGDQQQGQDQAGAVDQSGQERGGPPFRGQGLPGRAGDVEAGLDIVPVQADPALGLVQKEAADGLKHAGAAGQEQGQGLAVFREAVQQVVGSFAGGRPIGSGQPPDDGVAEEQGFEGRPDGFRGFHQVFLHGPQGVGVQAARFEGGVQGQFPLQVFEQSRVGVGQPAAGRRGQGSAVVVQDELGVGHDHVQQPGVQFPVGPGVFLCHGASP